MLALLKVLTAKGPFSSLLISPSPSAGFQMCRGVQGGGDVVGGGTAARNQLSTLGSSDACLQSCSVIKTLGKFEPQQSGKFS